MFDLEKKMCFKCEGDLELNVIERKCKEKQTKVSTATPNATHP